MTEAPVVVVEHLTRTYASSAGEVHAVRDVSFEIPRGQLVALVGAGDELAVLVEGHAVGIARRVHEDGQLFVGHGPLEDLV